jgi:hypothetical protein
MTLLRYQNVPSVEKCSISSMKADSYIIEKDVGVYERFSILRRYRGNENRFDSN